MSLNPKKPDEIQEVPKTPEIQPEKENPKTPFHPEIHEKILPNIVHDIFTVYCI